MCFALLRRRHKSRKEKTQKEKEKEKKELGTSLPVLNTLTHTHLGI
jgi:hypothetical protein